VPKPKPKVLKYILITGGVFAGLVLLLLVAAAIIIPLKYPPEKLKTLATEKLSQALKRNVAIGEIKFNVLSGFAITDLKIGNRPGWDPRPFVSAKDISISYHLFPLLWGEVSLGEIKLNQPDILVERRNPNQFNFSDMAGNDPAAASAPQEDPAVFSWFASPAFADNAAVSAGKAKPSNSSMNISVDSISINHGRMVYLDETTSPRQESDLSDLNFKANNISMTGQKTTFSIDTPFTYGKLPYRLAVNGSFRYLASNQSLKDLSVKGTMNDLGFQVSGDAQNLTGDFTPNMDGNASLDMLKFSGLIPKSLSSMPEGLSLSGPAKVSFHLDGSSSSGLRLKGTADGAELDIHYKDLFIKQANTTCKLEFTSVKGNDYFDLPSFQANFQDWEVTGAFHYKNGVSYSCEIHSKSLPLQGLSKAVPKFSKATFSGEASLDFKCSQLLGKPQSFNMEGQAQLKGIGIALPNDPNLFHDLTGPVVMKGSVISLPEATFKTFEGTGSASIQYNMNNSSYGYGFKINNVSAQEAMDGWVDVAVTKDQADFKDKLFGTLSMTYQGTGKGFGADEMIATAAGSGTYVISNARLTGLPALKTIGSVLKDQSGEMGMDSIVGNLGMKNRIFSYTSTLTGKVGVIRVAGGIDLVKMNYEPDMKVACDLKKDAVNLDSFKSQIPSDKFDINCVADNNGIIPLDFRFTGPVKKVPGPGDYLKMMDTQRLMKNVLNCYAKKATNALGNNLGDKLKGLFGK
jgi:hypothetical protein